MGLKVKAEPKESYLHIFVSGEYDQLELAQTVNLVLALCVEHKSSKVLVDIRSITGSIPSMDRFYFGETFAVRYFEEKKTEKISHVRFAFLGHYPIIDPNKFGETVAVNRGMTLKVATEIKEALDWLLVE